MTRDEKMQRIKANFAKWRGCCASVFEQDENVILEGDGKLFFAFAQFGGSAVIWADKAILDWCKESFLSESSFGLRDFKSFRAIQKKMLEHGEMIECRDYYFARLNEGKEIGKPDGIELEKIHEKDRLGELHKNEDKNFPNALTSEDCSEDFALLARKEDKIIGLATALEGWIYIDTLDGFRGQGIASYLTKEIAQEIEKRGEVPVYVTWSDNIASTRTAINAGFVPVGTWYATEYKGGMAND